MSNQEINQWPTKIVNDFPKNMHIDNFYQTYFGFIAVTWRLQ